MTNYNGLITTGYMSQSSAFGHLLAATNYFQALDNMGALDCCANAVWAGVQTSGVPVINSPAVQTALVPASQAAMPMVTPNSLLVTGNVQSAVNTGLPKIGSASDLRDMFWTWNVAVSTLFSLIAWPVAGRGGPMGSSAGHLLRVNQPSPGPPCPAQQANARENAKTGAALAAVLVAAGGILTSAGTGAAGITTYGATAAAAMAGAGPALVVIGVVIIGCLAYQWLSNGGAKIGSCVSWQDTIKGVNSLELSLL